MHVNATSALPGRSRGIGIFVVLVVSLIAFGWAVHRHDYGPHSMTIIGISEPGSGAGIYNGLRAKSVPAITDISRLEQRAPAARLFSLMETDLVQ
jgi:hypothetical protein